MKTTLNPIHGRRLAQRWTLALPLCALALSLALPAHADGGWRGPHAGRGHYGYGWGYYGALPAFATVLTLGALTYWVADGVYYRAVPSGGYVVVPAPLVAAPEAVAAAATSGNRLFVYPRNAQSKDQQAGDEFQCHQWAVGQTGFDPSLAAAAPPADQEPRQNYRRAQLACLDGRGYSVN